MILADRCVRCVRLIPASRVLGAIRSKSTWKVDPLAGTVWETSSSSKDPVYQVIVGLEIHAQLNIPTKLFSPASISSSSLSLAANQGVHPLDLAVPGKLPRVSASAVRTAVLAAAALKCHIPLVSRFERKHYSYADLPLGYQITQQRWPLAMDGLIECSLPSSSKKKSLSPPIRCRINRIQLEQDTGKTTITTERTQGYETTWSRVDFGRAGSALIEIVTEPDLKSSQEAVSVVQSIRQLLMYTGSCNGKMEEGQFRVDCNVNLSRLSDKERTPRAEVKNLNSIKQVQDAINYEAVRQASLWENESGELQHQETRTWDVTRAATRLIRRKEGAEDYRFLPEPDLPPLVLNADAFGGSPLQDFIAQNLPELPWDAVQRLTVECGLSDYQARVIAGDPPAIQLFDSAIQAIGGEPSKSDATAVANLLCNELFGLIKEHASDESDSSAANSAVSGTQIGELILLQREGIISSTMAKKLLSILFSEEHGKSPREVAADRGFQLIKDPAQLRELCREVVESHPEELEVYRKGGKFATKITKLFIGKAMAASKGNAHPERLQEVLTDVLEEVAPGV